jgi:3-phosphoglycerate kinase
MALVLEWAEHRDEFTEDWNLCSHLQTPKSIEPLKEPQTSERKERILHTPDAEYLDGYVCDSFSTIHRKSLSAGQLRRAS